MFNLRRFSSVCVCLFSLLAWTNTIGAQEISEEDSPVTDGITDPRIGLSRLKVLLRPLTCDDLQNVARDWQGLLQEQIRAVGRIQIQVQGLEEESDDKELRQQLIELRTQENAIAARTEMVVNALKAKGGDVTQYEDYLSAVSTISGAADSVSYWAALRADMISWAAHEDGGMKYLKRMGIATSVLFLFWIASRVAGHASANVLARQKKTSQLLENFVNRTVGGAVMLLGTLIGLAILGLPVAPMMAALGGGGFIIGFAMQETLGNFASGLLIMVYRPFDLNDYVSVAGAEGRVQEMSLVATTLLTPDNKVLVIPNKKAWGQTIMNFTGCDTRRIDLVFKISYEDDIQQAIRVLLDTARGHDLVLDEPGVGVHVAQLADTAVNLTCRPWVRTPDYWTVHADLTHEVKDRFDTESLGFPAPRRQIDSANKPDEVG